MYHVYAHLFDDNVMYFGKIIIFIFYSYSKGFNFSLHLFFAINETLSLSYPPFPFIRSTFSLKLNQNEINK